MRQLLSARRATAALAAALLAGCSGTAAPVPPAAGPSPRVPIATSIVPTTLVVNLDQYLIANEGVAFHNQRGPQHVSTDGGRTWQVFGGRTVGDLAEPDVPASSPRLYAAGAQVTYAADHSVYRYDFAGGANPELVTTKAYIQAVGRDYVVSADMIGDEGDLSLTALYATDYSTGRTRTLEFLQRYAGAADRISVDDGAWALVPSGATGDAMLDVLSLTGGPHPEPLRIDGNLYASALRGTQAIYLTGGADGPRLCLQSFTAQAWGAASCVPIEEDRPFDGAGLTVGRDWVVVALDPRGVDPQRGQLDEFIVPGTDTVASANRIPPSGPVIRLAGTGLSERPLVRVGDTSDGYIGSVAEDGTVTKAFDFVGPGLPHSVWAATMTPDRWCAGETPAGQRAFSVGESIRPGPNTWCRPASDAGLGEESALGLVGTSVATSAGRTLVVADDGFHVLDRGVDTRTLQNPARALDTTVVMSGPYFLTGAGDVRRVDGASPAHPVQADAIFGSLALVTDATKDRAEVVDVESGQRWPIPLTKEWSASDFDDAALWGDWVLVSNHVSTQDDFETTVLNYRTGEQYSTPSGSWPVLLGDGFVLRYDGLSNEGRLNEWDFLTGAQRTIADYATAVASDGSRRLVYSTGSELVLETLSGVGASAPRTLGVIAPDSVAAGADWTFELDATKPLGAGSLVLSRDGSEVRRTGFDASPDGSLRLAWDGRDASGAAVTPGEYTWQVDTSAADGTGALVGVDGTAGVTGTLTVTG